MTGLNELHKTVVTLPADTEIHTERIFDAPPEVIWDCFMDPELLKQWLGPDRLEMRVDEFDARPGGKWSYVHIDSDGTEYRFFGEFVELDRPVRAVQTFNFVMEPQPPPSVDELNLIPLENDQTRLVTKTTFESREQRDGMIQAGMEKGMNEGYEKLDSILAGRER
ncbi:MAG: SRPBCC family protein [Solirubrobacterales bacterium]|nr:SRPBCC family protein [Solirubrobacterales bacterium]MCB0860882.1 SRPBCC family protein [Solirubrobacterales bacterium]